MQASEAQKSHPQQMRDAVAAPNAPASDVSAGQASSPPPHTVTSQSSAANPPRGWFGLGWLGMVVVMLAAALGGYWFSQRMDRVETSAARRLQGADQRIVQLEAQTKLYQDELRELGSRASVLES